jgi:phosphoglycolate phosphatase
MTDETMPQPPRPLIVFDLDGTLVDSAADLIGTLNVILARETVAPVALDRARFVVGAGARTLIERGLAASGKRVGEQKLESMYREFLSHYEDHMADQTMLFPGVVDSLDRFEQSGFQFAVCTNKLERISAKLLRLLGIADRFQAICGQDTFGLPKPNPNFLWRTIDQAKGDRNRSVMVGDSRTDIDTAKAAGVPVIAVDFGYSDRDIRSFTPDRVISHFNSLFDAVAELDLVGLRP